jgi:hypothetical protein
MPVSWSLPFGQEALHKHAIMTDSIEKSKDEGETEEPRSSTLDVVVKWPSEGVTLSR